MTEINPLSAEYWNQRYQEGSDPWNLGFPAPPFVNLMASAARLAPGRMAVLGCGHGQEALFFAEQGFEVVGCDFSALAIAAAQSAAHDRGLSVEFLLFGSRFEILSLEPALDSIERRRGEEYLGILQRLS
jgi:SAM-dependent methyltransferase